MPPAKVEQLRARARNSWLAQQALRTYGRARGTIRGNNFLILGSVRSGTTVLVDYLNCHHRIRCEGEILGENQWRYGDAFRMQPDRLRLHFESYFVKRSGMQHGAKLLTYHLDELPLKLSDCLDILDDPAVLVIYRRRLLEQFLSLRTAQRTHVWHVESAWECPPVWLTPNDFLDFAERERRMWQDNAETLKRARVHYLCYEDLALSPAAEVHRALEFLGLEPCAIRTKLVKQNRRSISQQLANYREFVRLGLSHTELHLPLQDRQSPSRSAPRLRAA